MLLYVHRDHKDYQVRVLYECVYAFVLYCSIILQFYITVLLFGYSIALCEALRTQLYSEYSKTRYKKLFTHVESHASALSLLESGEQRYIKAINNNNNNNNNNNLRHTNAILTD